MATPIRTRKISHVLLHVSDIERSVKFYTDILGFKESDRNQLGMVFLRNGTDHHSFGLVPGPADAALAPKDKYLTFHHMALEVGSVDDLFSDRAQGARRPRRSPAVAPPDPGEGPRVDAAGRGQAARVVDPKRDARSVIHLDTSFLIR